MLDDINALIQHTAGQYIIKLVNIGLGFLAGHLAFTPDPNAAGTISNVLLACVTGGVALLINHFTHPAAPAAPAVTPTK